MIHLRLDNRTERMFGRIRPSSSSPESLERPPSKILKDDPISIYEATLMKLKLGSQRELSSPSEQTVQIEVDFDLSSSCAGATSNSNSSENTAISPCEEVIAIDTKCSSRSGSPDSVDTHSTGSMKEQQSRSNSVLYLFSKFMNSREVACLSCEDAMQLQDGCSSIVSTTSSDRQSLGHMELEMDQECVSSLPFSQM
ncbi:hypothetical protein I3843_12G035500 [Carya illinoinensis]|uniref:Uncharacterized protein n=2 Tax=Carya illinoinensis TaxID=32201 RepID=A0A922DGA9_CARIL|nr:uncharacterized protein LOC122290081 isoform X1 [Carya illinoinensis]KAG6683877.1 hypothetical protein I3842_12G034600 [Carya illinoinensis]KAG7951989.1 hypothetical protein I3843_12G035500 [Carya illinoinensis]